MPLVTSGIIAGWSALNALATLNLSSYRDSDLLKRSAIIHITFALIAFCFFSWQALFIYTSLQITASLLAARSIRYLSGKEAQTDNSGRIFALANHLKTLAHEPPYNVFYGRLYPTDHLAPIAIATHSLHLVYLYLKGKNPTPEELANQALRALHEETLAIFNELATVHDTPHSKTSPPTSERKLLEWHIEIVPLLDNSDIRKRLGIDSKTAAYMERVHKSIAKNAILFLWRQLLSEPIPEQDLLYLMQNGALPDSSYNLEIWVRSYNREERLHFDHLHALFERLDETATPDAIEKAFFLLMDKCALLPYKGPEHSLDGMHPIPGVIRVDREGTILHFADAPSLLAYLVAWKYSMPEASFRSDQKEFLTEHFKTKCLNETTLQFSALKEAKKTAAHWVCTGSEKEPPLYAYYSDRFWFQAICSWLEEKRVPSFCMDQFMLVGGHPLLVNPHYHVEQSFDIENWLVSAINPTDQGELNQWRIALFQQYGRRRLKKNEEAFTELSHESRAHHYLSFTYTLEESSKEGATMSGDVEAKLRTWHKDCKELVRRVQNHYNLEPKPALALISRMFEKELEKAQKPPTSALHALKFCTNWPIEHFMALIHQTYSQEERL